MFRYILDFLQTTRPREFYSKSYKDGYNKLWIQNIRNYRP